MTWQNQWTCVPFEWKIGKDGAPLVWPKHRGGWGWGWGARDERREYRHLTVARPGVNPHVSWLHMSLCCTAIVSHVLLSTHKFTWHPQPQEDAIPSQACLHHLISTENDDQRWLKPCYSWTAFLSVVELRRAWHERAGETLRKWGPSEREAAQALRDLLERDKRFEMPFLDKATGLISICNHTLFTIPSIPCGLKSEQCLQRAGNLELLLCC